MNSHYLLFFFFFGVESVIVRPQDCPRAHNFSDEVYISFERFIVPKIEVLIGQNISKRSIGSNDYFRMLPHFCVPDPLSMARTNVLLGRINFISETIANSRKFQIEREVRSIQVLSPQMERLMRRGIIEAGETELNNG